MGELVGEEGPVKGMGMSQLTTVPQVILAPESDLPAVAAVRAFHRQFGPGRALYGIGDRVTSFLISQTGARLEPHEANRGVARTGVGAELLRLAALAPAGRTGAPFTGAAIGTGAPLAHLVCSVFQEGASLRRMAEFTELALSHQKVDIPVISVLWVLTDYRPTDFAQIVRTVFHLADRNSQAMPAISRLMLLPAHLSGVRQSLQQQVEMLSDILVDLAESDLGSPPATLLRELFSPPERGTALPVLVVGAHTVTAGRKEVDSYLAHRLSAEAVAGFLVPEAAVPGPDQSEEAVAEAAAEIADEVRQAREALAVGIPEEIKVASVGLREPFEPRSLMQLSMSDRVEFVRTTIRQTRAPGTGLLAQMQMDLLGEIGTRERLGAADAGDIVDELIGQKAGGVYYAIGAMRAALQELGLENPLPARPIPELFADEGEADPVAGLKPRNAPLAPLLIWVMLLTFFTALVGGMIPAMLSVLVMFIWQAAQFWRTRREERRASGRPLDVLNAYLEAYGRWLAEVWAPARQRHLLLSILLELESTATRWRADAQQLQQEAALALGAISGATWTTFSCTAQAAREEGDQVCAVHNALAVQTEWARRLDCTHSAVDFGTELRQSTSAALKSLALQWAREHLHTEWLPAPLHEGEGDPAQFLSEVERFCCPPGSAVSRVVFCHNRESPVFRFATAQGQSAVDRLDEDRLSVWLLASWRPEQEV